MSTAKKVQPAAAVSDGEEPSGPQPFITAPATRHYLHR